MALDWAELILTLATTKVMGHAPGSEGSVKILLLVRDWLTGVCSRGFRRAAHVIQQADQFIDFAIAEQALGPGGGVVFKG